MSRKALAEARWELLQEEMRRLMIEVARQRTLITYAELCVQVRTASIHHRSPMLVRLLNAVGEQEAAAGRPILPAVVVAKATGMPGAGYFKSDFERGAPSADAVAMWQADLLRVYDYWSEHT